jgi:hypothetical protein
MSEIRVNKIVNEAGSGSVEFAEGATLPSGKNLSGSGTITMNVTGNVSGNAGGLTGTPNVVVGSVTGTTGSFTGNVSVGGTLTYEDVTNIDSVGVVTARTGIKVLAGGADIVGVTTTKGGLTTQKLLKEEVNVVANKLSAAPNIYLENGCVHIFTTAESTTSTPAIKYSSGVNLKDMMSVGESVVVTLITTANANGYSAQITIDGDAVTENWIGGSAPSGGGSSGVDVHTFTIIKVASSGTTDAQLTVIANHSKTS